MGEGGWASLLPRLGRQNPKHPRPPDTQTLIIPCLMCVDSEPSRRKRASRVLGRALNHCPGRVVESGGLLGSWLGVLPDGTLLLYC